MNHMSQSAVITLSLVWGFVLINMCYCFFRILTSKRNLGSGEEHE